jgi:nucleoside-diphosphate-sugar epimerase
LITKKKILIVGGTGFIGYHLAKKSLKKGWQVTSISSNRPKKK